jgi:hypothetical protein
VAFRFQLAEAFVKLTLDDKGFNAAIANARKRLAGLRGLVSVGGGGMNRLFMGGASLGSLASGGILGGLVVAAGKAASEAQEMEQRFKQVFRDLSAEAKHFSIEFAGSLNRSFHQVMNTMAGFQLEFTAQGMGRGQAMGMSMELTKLTSDLAAFHNMAESDVGSRMFRAMVGNHRALYELGIVMNQAALEQAALNEGFKDGFKDLGPLEKMMVRYAYIMRASADASGQAKREMGFLASKWRQLTDAVHELAIGIGTLLTPALLAAVNKAAEVIKLIHEAVDPEGADPERSWSQGQNEPTMAGWVGATMGAGLDKIAAAWVAKDYDEYVKILEEMQAARIPDPVMGVSPEQIELNKEDKRKAASEATAAAIGEGAEKMAEWASKVSNAFGGKMGEFNKSREPGLAAKGVASFFSWFVGKGKEEKKTEAMRSSFMDPIQYVRAIQESINNKALNIEKEQLVELKGISGLTRGVKEAIAGLKMMATIQPDF